MKQRYHKKERKAHGMQQLLASDVLADGRSKGVALVLFQSWAAKRGTIHWLTRAGLNSGFRKPIFITFLVFNHCRMSAAAILAMINFKLK